MLRLSEVQLKETELQILDYIDNLCKKNGIVYFLIFGTLLGAIRHKGFIPWDDDVDLCMDIKNYEKFIKKVKEDGKYQIINHDTDSDYYFPFSRVSDKNTILKFRNMREIHNMGVFIDIFPINETPEPTEIESWKKKCLELQHKVRATVPSTAHIQSMNLKYFLQTVRQYPERKRLGTNNYERYCTEWLKTLRMYNGTNSEHCAIDDAYCLTRKSFSDVCEVEFEGKKYFAPKDYNLVLHEIYGDYMKLPPKEKQVSVHHFTAYYKE